MFFCSSGAVTLGSQMNYRGASSEHTYYLFKNLQDPYLIPLSVRSGDELSREMTHPNKVVHRATNQSPSPQPPCATLISPAANFWRRWRFTYQNIKNLDPQGHSSWHAVRPLGPFFTFRPALKFEQVCRARKSGFYNICAATGRKNDFQSYGEIRRAIYSKSGT